MFKIHRKFLSICKQYLKIIQQRQNVWLILPTTNLCPATCLTKIQRQFTLFLTWFPWWVVELCLMLTEVTIFTDAHGGWQHGVVCHRCHFVDPITGWTTKDIERVWRFIKQYFRGFQPIQPQFCLTFSTTFLFVTTFVLKETPNATSLTPSSLQLSVRSVWICHCFTQFLNWISQLF